MNGDNFLLDTNIVLYITEGNEDLKSFLNQQRITISVISEMELLSFPSITKKEIAMLSTFIAEMEVLPMNDKVKNAAITIRRKYKLKLPDSIIAATAIANGLPLITADKQFKMVDDLQLLFYHITNK